MKSLNTVMCRDQFHSGSHQQPEPTRSGFRFAKFAGAMAAALSLSLGDAFANDAGGGTAGTGANVTVSVSGNNVTLANGIISAVIDKTTGRITSYKFNGTQMVDTSAHIYYSMDGGSSYEGPHNCVYRATVNTTDMVDISCKQTWRSGAGYLHAVDIDVHYVLRRGDTGLYAYVIMNHPSSYPALTIGEWRMVWRLPHDANNFYFERAYVDNLRNWKTPTYFDYQHDAATGIAEVTKMQTGGWSGQFSCKYMYNAEYYAINTWGQASDTNKKGAWFVLGPKDYFNDGPTHTDLTLGEGYMLIHFGRNHFGGSQTSVAAGESWRKMYGPFLLYCNSSTASSGAGNALWADAKAQATAENNAGSYSWLTYQPDFPVASKRGKVTGKLVVVDTVRPAANASGGWVGLAQPNSGGNWQFESKRYQYWAKTDSSGNFTIPNVRPGTYTLYAYTLGGAGSVGEYSRGNVVVSAGGTLALGNVTWNVKHPGSKIAWEIGIPNRSASEFKHGSTDYFKPYKWLSFRSEFSNPLVYTIGSSTPANNWNYAHCPWLDSSGNAAGSWPWKINFNLASVPASGNATLTLAFAGSSGAHMFVYVNSATQLSGDFYPANAGGNGLLREGIHCKYGVNYVTIPVSRLKVGANTITLVQGSTRGAGNHAMYDYLSLELP
ncbi:MAG: hypothetical protein H7Y43_16570 [Akkermansiaceae bacterium]|nr:hypothetical protein [Verrucomicrobiales bacterium]